MEELQVPAPGANIHLSADLGCEDTVSKFQVAALQALRAFKAEGNGASQAAELSHFIPGGGELGT